MDPASEIPSAQNSRRLSIISHLGGLSPLIGLPGFVVPLVIWLMERDSDPYVERQAREALNFQISMGIYSTVLILLIGMLWIVAIGIFLIPVLGVLWLLRFILCIIAAVRAGDGRFFRYPLTIRFV